MSKDFRFEADFKQIPPETVFIEIFYKKRSGFLDISLNKAHKRYFFLKGTVIYFESNLRDEHLLNALHKEGKIDEARFANLTKIRKKNEIRVYDCLLEHGGFSRDFLNNYLRKKIAQSLLQTFSWKDGRYVFEALDEQEDWDIPFVSMNFPEIMMMTLKNGMNISRMLDYYSAEIERPFLLGENFSFLDSSFKKVFPDFPDIQNYFGSDIAIKDIIEEFKNHVNRDSQLGMNYQIRVSRGVLILLSFNMIRADFEKEAVKKKSLKTEKIPTASEKASESFHKYQDDTIEEVVARTAKFSTLRSTLDEFNGFMKTPWKIFGIKELSSKKDLEKSYLKLMKKYHPDHFIDQEMKDQAEQIIYLLGEAREEFIMHIDSPKQASKARMDDSQVESLISRGKANIDRGNFSGALEFLRAAYEFSPSNADLLANLGWAEFLSSHGKSNSDAKKYISEAMVQDSKNDQAIYFLGIIYKSEQDFETAKTLFEKAVSTNSDNYEARKELEMMQSKESKGGFKKVFRKFFGS